jgi:lipoprotein NlpI
MRLIVLVWVVSLAVVAGAVIISRQERHRLATQDRDNCVAAHIDPDRSIAGCSPIIQNGSLTQETRTIAYANRSAAYFNKGDYDHAVADASEAIRLDPGMTSAYVTRGRAYANKLDFDHAIADYSEAIRLNPTNGFVYGIRAAVYFGKHDFERAIADASEAIRLDKANFFAYVTRGGAYFESGDLESAIADAGEVIRLEPKNAVVHAHRARLYAVRGDYDRAIADADQAIRLDPQNANAYFSRGLSHLYIGESANAFADFNLINRLDPRDAYVALWVDIAGQRANLPSQLPQHISQIDMTAWPAPMIRLFLGQLSPAEALATTDRSRRDQVCQANFYTGEAAMRAEGVEGARDAAIRFFRGAASICPKTFIERTSAIAELRSLGEVP